MLSHCQHKLICMGLEWLIYYCTEILFLLFVSREEFSKSVSCTGSGDPHNLDEMGEKLCTVLDAWRVRVLFAIAIFKELRAKKKWKRQKKIIISDTSTKICLHFKMISIYISYELIHVCLRPPRIPHASLLSYILFIYYYIFFHIPYIDYGGPSQSRQCMGNTAIYSNSWNEFQGCFFRPNARKRITNYCNIQVKKRTKIPQQLRDTFDG